MAKKGLWTLSVFKGNNNRWFYHWKSNNGRTTVNGSTGLGWKTKWGAKWAAHRAINKIANSMHE